MAPEVYHGRQAEVHVADTLEEIPAEDDIYSFITEEASPTEYTGDVLDIDINDPEAPVEVENTFGGQFTVEEPSDLVEIEVTMRFRDIEIFSEMHGEPEEVGDTEFTRIEGAEGPGGRLKRAFLFRMEAEGDIVHYFINDALFQQIGDVTLDADGFAEISGTIVALVEKRVIESNF